MADHVSALTLELLSWVASRRRTYAEAMEAWQSTCPRHPVWEDALIDGLIQVASDGPLHQPEVTLTRRGEAVLAESNHASAKRRLGENSP
jgi:hypothetical protein